MGTWEVEMNIRGRIRVREMSHEYISMAGT